MKIFFKMAAAVSEKHVKGCGFFLKRKNRYCKMIPGKGKTFCGEHLYLSEDLGRKRVPCPLDKNHTVFEDQLDKHLKKCNVTKKRQVEYYEANINSGHALSKEEHNFVKVSLKQICKSKIQECINKVKAYFNGNELKITKSVLMDKNLEEEIDKTNDNLTLRKHLHQQSSLIGNLRKSELLNSDNIVVEFGAGRGLLSHWVQKSMKDESNIDFLLVDRASTRYKADSYHRGADQGPTFNRIQIDIEHLNLKKVPLILENERRSITGISKHLCGAATDLALRCLLGTSEHKDTDASADNKTANDDRASKRVKLDCKLIGGLVFALCCHHCCSWKSYVGRNFLENLGFTQESFYILCCLSSWATCGSRTTSKNMCTTSTQATEGVLLDTQSEGHMEQDVDNGECCLEHKELEPDEGSSIKALGFTKSESEEIGRQCKHIIDGGRVSFIKQHGLQASLIYYVERSVSLENVALVAWNT